MKQQYIMHYCVYYMKWSFIYW